MLEDNRRAFSDSPQQHTPSARRSVEEDESAIARKAIPVPSSYSTTSHSLQRATASEPDQARKQRVALAALLIACVAVFFTALDQTVVVTALPQIINDLQVPITQLDHASWIISAYLLGFIVVMPLMGRVSDIYGRRRIFLLCLVIFGMGSVFCGLAPLLGQMQNLGFLGRLGIDTSSPGLIWLIGARLFQAIGGGAIVPVAMAVASDFYGPDRRGLALGIIGAITEAGGVLGPLYGAIVVQHFGWQYIFYLNVPLVMGLLAVAWKFIPTGIRLREGVDWSGAILLGLALTCLSLGLAQQGTSLSPASQPGSQNNPLALALAMAFLLAFLLVEWKVHWPIVQLGLFKRLPFSATALVSLLIGSALIIAMADIPIFVDTVLQRPVLDSGLALLRLTAMIPIGALLGGWLCSQITCRLTAILGLLFTAAGFFLMSRWTILVNWNEITISTMTAGLGFGLVIAPIGTTAINAVKATQAGVSSAVVTALRMVGMMLGLAALTSWALAYFKQLAQQYSPLPLTATADQLVQWQDGYALHLIQSAHTVYCAVFFASMVLCLIAIIPALCLWGRKPALNGEMGLSGFALANVPTLPLASAVGEAGGEVLLATSGPDRMPKGKQAIFRPLLTVLVCISLLFLLFGAVFSAAFWPQANDPAGIKPDTTAVSNDPAVVAGPRMIQLAFDKASLTSVFVSRLHVQPDVLSNLSVTPLPTDSLMLTMDLHINVNGLQRILPVELDTTIGVDSQQNLQLTVLHLKRDGLDAGPTAAAQMQTAMNQMLISSVMPSLRGHLKSVKLISAHTSASVACGRGVERLVLQIEAPPIKGIAAQPAPTPFCLDGAMQQNELWSYQAMEERKL